MTKKSFFTVVMMGLIALLPMPLFAQTLSVVSTDYSGASFTFATPELSVNVQEVQGEPYTVVSFQGAVPSTELGAPDLPLFSKMIEIPLCGDVKVKVSNMRFRQLDNLKYRMMPVQPAPSKSDRNPLPFVLDSALYATDGYYELPPASVEKIGVARDRNLARLSISPLAYNPVTGEMLLVTSMTVTLQYEGVDMAATEQMHRRYYSPGFTVGQNVLQAFPSSKSVRRDAPLHYLIVSHNSFRGALDTFVQWKRKQGMIVTVAYTGDPDVGTSNTDIANYIKSYYTNATEELPAPTYLLLVGDHQQIAAFDARCTTPATDHITDLYFASWTDGDNIPDCYYGRFSARNIAELTPQIEKTLLYEQYGFANDNFLERGILIAGEDRGYNGDNAYRYADPAMDYIAAYYINAANGYNDVKYYKNNTTFAPTGVTVTGSGQASATASALRNYYNQGYGWVNYSAHGYDNEWSTPNFSTTHVPSMTNNGMPSVMIGNCCLSGKFNTTYDACLGEALLRKGNNAGAAMYIGATNSTYWPHDFCWAVGVRDNISNTMQPAYNANRLGMYDRLFHTHNESFDARYITAGSMVMSGNMAVQERSDNNTYALYYWEIYELFGDPSMLPWLGKAADMAVEAPSVITLGSATYTARVPQYSYVALVDTVNGSLVSAAFADQTGLAVLDIPSDITAGPYTLAVTAQNYKPYFQQVMVIVQDGPYVMVTEIKPTNDCLKPGQISTFDITVTNVGNQLPSWGIITLESQTPGVVPVSPYAHFNAIAPGDTVSLTGVCPTYVADELADGKRVKFTATVDFGPGTSTKRAQYSITAPVLALSNAWITPDLRDDSTSVITCSLVNKGHDTTDNLTITLPNLFGFMTDDAEPQNIGRLAPGSAVDLSIPVTMVSALPSTSIPFHIYANDSNGAQLVQVLSFRANGSETEDFETGDFTKFNWVQSSRPWEITSQDPYAGTFSARSKSNLSNRTESRMSINWTATLADSVSFYYKVSSEDGYDLFRFFIDGYEMLSASGEVDWQYASFPVSAGTHNMAFSYAKDTYSSSGGDCAWIDNVKLPFSGAISHFVVDSVCQNGEYVFDTTPVPTDQTGHYNYNSTADGQLDFLSLYVVESPQVTIEVIGQPAIGDCFMLKASGASSYTWSNGDSTAYISVCPQSTLVEYSVEGCRAGCCTTATVTLEVLDIDPQPAQQAVWLYPNPARDRVTVQAEQMRSIEVLTLMGQTVIRKPVNVSETILDLQKLPKGIYFIKVETANGVSTQKLVLR